jgi:Tol biopolymer transport system component
MLIVPLLLFVSAPEVAAGGTPPNPMLITTDIVENTSYGRFWSPSGDKLVYCAYTYDSNGVISSRTIYTIAPDGSNKTRIAEGCEPQWSPDGSRIYFAKIDNSPPYGGIWSMDTGGE